MLVSNCSLPMQVTTVLVEGVDFGLVKVRLFFHEVCVYEAVTGVEYEIPAKPKEPSPWEMDTF